MRSYFCAEKLLIRAINSRELTVGDLVAALGVDVAGHVDALTLLDTIVQRYLDARSRVYWTLDE